MAFESWGVWTQHAPELDLKSLLDFSSEPHELSFRTEKREIVTVNDRPDIFLGVIEHAWGRGTRHET